MVAVLGIGVTAPQPAAADGIIGNGTKVACYAGGGLLGAVANGVSKVATGETLCGKLGRAVDKKVKEEWNAVWDSVLGDVVTSAADVLKWMIKKVLIVALLGPSLDLNATGLWRGGGDSKPTLAGMLAWLGLIIAVFGAMWQLGKMALTGQMKYAGQAMSGWVQNVFLSAAGVGVVALLLSLGDTLTTSLVDATFDNDGKAYERIVTVMVPQGVGNPVTMLCVVTVLLLVGFIQLVLVFLRQSIIPIQCLLLPIAGAGRVGGDSTRKWAPRLITSICVAIAYKPLLAIIICCGFAEFGHSQTLVEWLRGCATLILGILAPGPLMKIFAPFAEVVGSGVSAGGAMGGLGQAAAYFAGKGASGSDGPGPGGPGPGGPGPGGPGPDRLDPDLEGNDAVRHAQMVQQSMGPQTRTGQDGGDSTVGSDAHAQVSRNEASQIPAQAQPGVGGATGAAGTAGAGGATGAVAGSGGAAAAAPGIGAAIQVLDGINDVVQKSSDAIGSGGTL
ncbi:hypothetical protein [Streptomyces sp. NPDC094437]|uniref:hypothetical protein n=1 Tax=Streptomyces sp. NPDC094437 TaxID=3366060 RepID=UPI0038272798